MTITSRARARIVLSCPTMNRVSALACRLDRFRWCSSQVFCSGRRCLCCWVLTRARFLAAWRRRGSWVCSWRPKKLWYKLVNVFKFLVINSYPVAVPVFLVVRTITHAELKVSGVWWQCKFEAECVINHISAARTDDLRISTEGVGLWLPTVPSRADENFLVETEVFHLHSSDNSRFRLLNDDVLERHVVCFQFASVWKKSKCFSRSFWSFIWE